MKTLASTLWLAAALLACDAPDAPDAPDALDAPATQRADGLAHAGRWAVPADVLAEANRATVTITEAGPWRGEASCSGSFTQGAQRFKEWVLAHWPQVVSVGGYSCRSINGNNAVTSIHAVGRAVDIHIALDAGEADNDLGDPLANYLLVHADEIGIQRVIWDRSYWRAGNSPREGEYTGAHPHHDHLHVELSVEAAEQRTPFFTDGLRPPDLGPCGDPLPAGGGVVDDDSPCFLPYGPGQFWRSVGGEGIGGGLLWTNVFENDGPSNWARWRFSVQAADRYTVEVHSVAAYSRYDAVRYEVLHAGGAQEVRVNLAGRTGWTPLGDFRFEPGAEYAVSLFDHEGHAVGADLHVTADAIRLRPVAPAPAPDAAPPPPPPRDAAPPPPAPLDAAPPPPALDAGPPPPVRDALPPPPEGDPWDAAPALDAAELLDAAPAGSKADAGRDQDRVAFGAGCQGAPGPAPGWLLLLALPWWRRRRAR